MQLKSQGLKFTFLDNVDPNGIYQKLDSLKDKLETTLFVVVSTTGVPDFDHASSKSAIAAAELDDKDEVEGRILLANGALGSDLA